MTDIINKIIKETKKKIYIAMFGVNFVEVEKIIPAEDKEVEKLLTLSLDKAMQKAREETARDICQLLDDIELKQQFIKGSTLEEWKQWKHIRNAIRDKYLKKG